jgi:pyrroloquinoline quinone biosynthesis protein B
VLFRQVVLDAFTPLLDVNGERSGLAVCAFPVAGKVPIHMETWLEPSAETNVGLIIEDERSGARLLYVPGAGSIEGIAERTLGVTCLFFDGTFWSDRELAELGQSARTARDMAHLPVGGPGGSLEGLAALPVQRRFYTHLNNTNPMLREGSPERRAVEARGWSVAEDGLEIML